MSQAEQGDPEAQAYLAALPKLPRTTAHLWEWFVDPVTGLHHTRQSNGMGPSRLTRAEIRQWQRDERIPLEMWERRALLAIDAAWAKAAAEDLNRPREEKAHG